MEARRESLSSIKICRFCLAQGDTLTSIYEKRSTKNTVNLPLKILSCISTEVFPSDKMPTYICNRCKFFIELSYDFKLICRQADENVLQFIQNASPLAPMSWPQSLLKFYRLANKAPEVMKTVIEGGTTVQVTAQESDTDEEDDENVYNVKIGDGSDDGSKTARVKVITGADKQEKGKSKRGKGTIDRTCVVTKPYPILWKSRTMLGLLKVKALPQTCCRLYQVPTSNCFLRFLTAPKLARHVQAHTDERSFPCKYCDKSFVHSHHYTRHLRLKHRETIRTCRGPFGESDQYRCEQCEDSFATQDELIYHSAIHATQNLTCPLCQEKFEDVDGVTLHIKSHSNGTQFMCELCELIFTSKEKLDSHLRAFHVDEIRSVPNIPQDEPSSAMDVDEDEDSAINVKELDDHMVVEIKKPNDYLIPIAKENNEDKVDTTNSEESDSELPDPKPQPDPKTLPDLATAVELATKNNETAQISIATIGGATITKTVTPKKDVKADNQTASILRKAEEVKKQIISQATSDPIAVKKTKNKTENNSAGTSDKSLRMLEKDLQELKRTHPRNEGAKTPAKPLENLRNRRAQIHTSTPKPRTPTDDRKMQIISKSPVPEKKLTERRVVTKENKEPKESKDAKASNGNSNEDKEKLAQETKEKEAKTKEIKEKEVKENEAKEKEGKEKENKEKEVKENEGKEKETKEKELKQKEVKEKASPKAVIKNGSDKGNSEEPIRRSTRPSKIKNYAKMIQDRSQDSDDEIDDSEDGDDDDEYQEVEKTNEPKQRPRRVSTKTTTPKATPPPVPLVPRKRGRPRKDAVAAKVRKEEIEVDDDDGSESEKEKPKTTAAAEKERDQNASEGNKSVAEVKPQGTLVSGQTPQKEGNKSVAGVKPLGTLVSGQTLKKEGNKPVAEVRPQGTLLTGQMLKKIPITSLPPGVKAIPLPVNARVELCEMQSGKKVKIQKMIVTKAEVAVMAKKGMVEMKGETMVLKQGIKIPTAAEIKSSRMEVKESPSSQIAAPSRCDFGDDA